MVALLLRLPFARNDPRHSDRLDHPQMPPLSVTRGCSYHPDGLDLSRLRRMSPVDKHASYFPILRLQ
jgi:hypothetical protein